MSYDTQVVITAANTSSEDEQRITTALTAYTESHGHAAGFEQINPTHPYVCGGHSATWVGKVNYLDETVLLDTLAAAAQEPRWRTLFRTLAVTLHYDDQDGLTLNTMTSEGQWTRTVIA